MSDGSDDAGTQLPSAAQELGRDEAAAPYAAVLRSLAAPPGSPFFARFLPGVLEALGADQVVVGELAGAHRERVHAIAAYGAGGLAENLEYDVGGMPCAAVVAGQIVLVPAEVRQRYPEGGLLTEFAVEGYAGAPVIGSSGAVLGVLCALYAGPIGDPARVQQQLPLFAVRAAAELERRGLELALRAAQARLATALDALPFDAWVCAEDGRYAVQNASSRKNWGVQLGRRPEEIEELAAPVLREWLENISRVQGGETVRSETTYRDGETERHVQKVLTRVRDEAGTYGIFGINVDVTALRVAERGRALAEARLARLLELTAAEGAVLTPDARFSAVTAALCRRLGARREELIGTAITALLHPDDRAAATGRLEQRGEGAPDRFAAVWRFSRPDGRSVPLRVEAAAVRVPGGALDSWVVLAGDGPDAGQSSSA